jgi:SAM-dependent methyltransferase
MSNHSEAAFSLAPTLAPVTGGVPAPLATPTIVRTPAFARRARPLHLADWVRPLTDSAPRLPAADWVLGMAQQILQRSAASAPGRWLEKLACGFNATPARQPLEAVLTPVVLSSLPASIWTEPTLLGEVLCAAREAENAPERRGRAGRVSVGSVYTPTAVARAIIEEVHVGARRVLDPSCGAGAFLLEAFQRAYHRRLESGADPVKAAEGALQHELAGIDIDTQALAVAEFSLRVQAFCLAGLTEDVPLDLRCADALLPLPGLDGQCECVVGNPPFIEGRGLSDAQLAAYRQRFRCAASGKINLFALFIERSLGLLKDGGVMALVLPATFQRNARYRALREALLEHTIESIKPLAPESFGGHVIETVVLRVRKAPPPAASVVLLCDGATPQTRLPMGPELRFIDHLPLELRAQVERMERQGVPLDKKCVVRDGISTGFQPFPKRLLGRLVAEKTFIADDGTRADFDPGIHKKIIDGGEFSAFSPVRWAGRHIEYDKRHEHQPPHPGRPFNCQLRDSRIYDRAEKLISRQTARGLIATLDRERYFTRNSIHVTHFREDFAAALSLAALCACFNSKLYCDYLLAVTGESGAVFPQVHIADIKRLPILPGLLVTGSELDRLGETLLALHAATVPDAAAITQAKAAVEKLLRGAFGV